jgi:tol-pal system protein YbgF
MTRSSRFNRAAALAAALLISAGCATKGDLRALRLEMSGMAERQDSLLALLARQSASTQDTLRSQTDQLFEIRGDVSRQLQNILDELAMLRELTGQNQRTIAGVRDQMEGLRRSGVGPGTTAGAAGPDQLGGQVAASGLAEQTYNTAVQLHARGSLTTAQRAFEAFLSSYGSHTLAPQARFYLGDILEQQDRLQEAIEAFNQIPELHPTAPRVPDALYRIGLLNLALENRQEGIRFLERVVNTFPDSDAAVLAEERLRELR